MFSKASKKSDPKAKAALQDAVASKPARPGATGSMAGSARKSMPSKPSGVPSIMSSDVAVTGSIESQGEVQLDGMLDGDVRAVTLIIGEKAIVKGEIICENVTVRGRVEGGIRARSVTLSSTSNIVGDIVHSTLQVETGAHFEGNCRHSDDPLSEDSSAPQRRDQARAAPRRSAPPAPKVAPTSDSNETGEAEANAAAEYADADMVDEPGPAPSSGLSPLRSKPSPGKSNFLSTNKSPLR